MTIFKIYPAPTPDGSFAAAWFDDDAYLWDDARLSSAAPLGEAWTPPLLKLYCPERGATAVLFNPNALAVSDEVKDALASFTEIEFLPIRIEGQGEFHIMHLTATVELPAGSKARTSSVSGNIVQIEAFPSSFAAEYSFFRVLQPAGSAARKSGATTRAIYANIAGAIAIAAFSRGCLAVSAVPSV